MEIEDIQEYYRKLEEDALRKGRLYTWNTEAGIFGAVNCREMYGFFRKAGLNHYKHFLDLGSGDGRVVLIASLFTDATGIEFDGGLHHTAEEAKRALKGRCTFLKEDFLHHNISKYDFLFINPDKGFQRGVQQKLMQDMRKDAVLYIYNEIFAPEGFLKGKKEWCSMIPVVKYTKK